MFGRVAVAGHSMEPSLREGDHLVFAPRARPRLADVVVARDPRAPSRLLVKRVLDEDGDALELASDAPGHERITIPRANVAGRVILRYWPLRRVRRF